MEIARREWRDDVTEVCAAAFERRLGEEGARLRIQTTEIRFELRRDMAELRADLRQELARLGAGFRQEMA
jgi:hypothetical protein